MLSVETGYRGRPHDCGEANFQEEEHYLPTVIADLFWNDAQRE